MPKFHQFDSFQLDVRSRDHNPPHFHVIGPDFHALIRIDTLELFRGDISRKAYKEAVDGRRSTGTNCWRNGDVSMSGTDDMLEAGDPLPTISHVEMANGPFRLLVRWAKGRRQGEEVIDLAPHLFAFKIYKPLRDDPGLFARVSVSENGTAVVWPGNADLEVSADALEDLAEDAMTSAQFSQWLRDMNLTFDAAAAQLGISRRLVAYYAREREVPRYIVLACEALSYRISNGDIPWGLSGNAGRLHRKAPGRHLSVAGDPRESLSDK